MEKGVSVIICCYNSEARLPETLAHLAKQKLSSEVQWEIIVVNNASTDNTVEVAYSEWEKYGLGNPYFKVIEQPIPGKNYAFELGVEKARFSYLITCDDDNWLKDSYIQIVYDLFENNSNIGAVGGQSTAVSDISLPTWFPEYQHSYAIGKQGKASGDVSKSIMLLWGAGMGLRNDVFQDAFSKHVSILSCRKGNNALSSGGDTEIAFRIMLMGYTLYYHEGLEFRHFIPKERLTLDYTKLLYASFDEADKVLRLYRFRLQIKWMPVIKRVWLLLKACVKRLFSLILLKGNKSNEFNAAVIFFTTGIVVKGVTDEMKIIKSISPK